VAEPVELSLWPEGDRADFLIARTGCKVERTAAESLSEALGGLPLAHEQAASYCDRLGISFSEYKERFGTTPTRLLDALRDAPGEYYGGRTVAKTFALAIEESAKLHPGAEPLIVHAALLAPEPIPLFLFSEAREIFGEPLSSALAGDGLGEAVAALRTFDLVEREAIPDKRHPGITTECIRLHRLVREVAAARAEGEARKTFVGAVAAGLGRLVRQSTRRRGSELGEAMLRTLIEAVAAVYPEEVFNDPKTWPRVRRLDALALALVGAMPHQLRAWKSKPPIC
jgi:hypothetical protein